MTTQRHIEILHILNRARDRDPLSTLGAKDLAKVLSVSEAEAKRELALLEERGLIVISRTQVGTRVFQRARISPLGVDCVEGHNVDTPGYLSFQQLSNDLPVRLTLTFTTSGDRVRLGWEADVLGVRESQLVMPYCGTALALVVRALDVLQYPNYPVPKTSFQRQRFAFDPDEQEWLSTSKLWSNGRVHRDAARRVGQALYRSLIKDPNGAQALGLVRDHAAALGRSLAYSLHFPPEALELAAVPWELIWEEDLTPLLLSRGRLAACTRYLDLAQALPPSRPSSGPLRILAITPRSGVPQGLRDEERASRQATWRPLLESGHAIMKEISPATRRTLVDVIQLGPQPDIVHYYGHGRYVDGEGALLLDHLAGGPDWTPAKALVTLFGDVRLVLLHACQGAMMGGHTAGLLTGVAPALSAAGVPVVIGMQLAIRAQAAIRASSVIYRALASGQSVQNAVSQARQALFVEEGDRVCWYVPVLYIRSRQTGPVHMRSAVA